MDVQAVLADHRRNVRAVLVDPGLNLSIGHCVLPCRRCGHDASRHLRQDRVVVDASVPQSSRGLLMSDRAGPARAHRIRCSAVVADDVGGLLIGDLGAREEALRLVLDGAAAGDPSAVRALRWIVTNYEQIHPTIYSRALSRAELFVDSSLATPLLSALGDEQYGCQAWAAMGCRAAGLRSAVPLLCRLLVADDWLVRVEAAAALGAVGDDNVVEDLAAALRHPVPSTGEAAASALAAVGTEAAVDALWAGFQRQASERIGYIASALARCGPAAAARLRSSARDDDPDRRYWAAVSLGALADEADMALLEQLTFDDTVTTFGRLVRTAAKRALRTSRRVRAAADDDH